LFLEALASCHSVTYVNEKIVGDPLDVSMFKSTGWVFDEKNTHSFGIT
jgi:magnesium-transporting ATPase (P-type)